MPSTQVRFKAPTPCSEGRTRHQQRDGGLHLNVALHNSGSSIAIPADGFTLDASHPQTGIAAPTVTGAFGSGQTAASQNVVFVNTGTVRGTLRRHTGVAVTGGFVVLYRNSPYLNTSLNVAATALRMTGCAGATAHGYLKQRAARPSQPRQSPSWPVRPPTPTSRSDDRHGRGNRTTATGAWRQRLRPALRYERHHTSVGQSTRTLRAVTFTDVPIAPSSLRPRSRTRASQRRQPHGVQDQVDKDLTPSDSGRSRGR